jgi:hypothetical protein
MFDTQGKTASGNKTTNRPVLRHLSYGQCVLKHMTVICLLPKRMSLMLKAKAKATAACGLQCIYFQTGQFFPKPYAYAPTGPQCQLHVGHSRRIGLCKTKGYVHGCTPTRLRSPARLLTYTVQRIRPCAHGNAISVPGVFLHMHMKCHVLPSSGMCSREPPSKWHSRQICDLTLCHPRLYTTGHTLHPHKVQAADADSSGVTQLTPNP